MGVNEGEYTYLFKGEEWLGTFTQFEGWDWIFYAAAPLDEFIAPAGELVIPVMSSIVMVAVAALIIIIYMSQLIARPFNELSKTSNEIAKGDLSARVSTKTPVREFSEVSEDINRMVDKLESNMKEIQHAIGAYSKVLNEVALGKLDTRVDTEQMKGEYQLLGDTLNSIVTILEWDTGELKKRDAELQEALTLYGYTLEKIVDEGDLSIRIDTDKLAGKHKLIGADINYLVSNLQTKIEESKKREKELKDVISSFSEVLDKTTKGDLSSRINTKGLNKELKRIGTAINTLIEKLEFERNRKKQ
jgi:methyl-accepting chemotaxis protein